jgi:hypothetical protein
MVFEIYHVDYDMEIIWLALVDNYKSWFRLILWMFGFLVMRLI